MPAMLDDPTAPAVYRVSGPGPYPTPFGALPPEVTLRKVTLRDRITTATLIPFSSPVDVPPKLTAYLCELLNREIEKGDTYPMLDLFPLSSFGPYWFANFGAIMVLGDVESGAELRRMEEVDGVDWSKQCLGSFYVKPNYPGRSSHVCNGGFLVTDAARNRGVGRMMGECYLEWAPKLGYSYSVFNLVYETNIASMRIWDALGFKRIGRIKGCGSLKSYPDQLIDAIMFGRELGGEEDESVTEERFDKIRFYLKTGTYPAGADRAEKSRLRSAATQYRLVLSPTGDDQHDKLMLKGKEVVSDSHQQYEIARSSHAQAHGGINKTTSTIAEKYHWVRIKETVSAAIRDCSECKEPAPKPAAAARKRRNPMANHAAVTSTPSTTSTTATSSLATTSARSSPHFANPQHHLDAQLGAPSSTASPSLVSASPGLVSGSSDSNFTSSVTPQPQPQTQQQSQHHPPPPANMAFTGDYGDMPLDPQIMQGVAQAGQGQAQGEAQGQDQWVGQQGPGVQQMSGVDVDMEMGSNVDGRAGGDDGDMDVMRRLRESLRRHADGGDSGFEGGDAGGGGNGGWAR